MKPQRLADADLKRLIDRAQGVPADVIDVAARIMDEVRNGGDEALRTCVQRFDRFDGDLWLDPARWDALAKACPADVRRAIDGNLARIQAFHERQRGAEDVVDVAPGVTLGRRPVPYAAVGCYVPGGQASYPSSVLMTVTPARIAGVGRIIVATPPRADGVDPAVAYAARAAGATDILLAGGAHAIAALAWGTESVPAVQAIVGPGNAYVTAAKQRIPHVRTDAPAGPSELLVLADEDAPVDAIAWDLIAQAEHDADAQVLLVTDSADLADRVAAVLADLAPKAARAAIVQASLRDHGAILVAESMDDAIDFTNAYAPEHLEIMTAEPRAVLERITAAGSVFLGPHAPVPVGDYGSGTNHVLPTMGHARIHGGLSVDQFRTWMTWQELTRDGLASIADDVAGLARAEGLIGHAEAVERRLEAP